MRALAKTVKVSSKGQITLPKQVREALGTSYVRIVLSRGHVHLEAVRDPAGCLAKYSRPEGPVDDAGAKAWTEVAEEKHGHR